MHRAPYAFYAFYELFRIRNPAGVLASEPFA